MITSSLSDHIDDEKEQIKKSFRSRKINTIENNRLFLRILAKETENKYIRLVCFCRFGYCLYIYIYYLVTLEKYYLLSTGEEEKGKEKYLSCEYILIYSLHSKYNGYGSNSLFLTHPSWCIISYNCQIIFL
jgi:hypothetical protein